MDKRDKGWVEWAVWWVRTNARPVKIHSHEEVIRVDGMGYVTLTRDGRGAKSWFVTGRGDEEGSGPFTKQDAKTLAYHKTVDGLLEDGYAKVDRYWVEGRNGEVRE